MKYLLFLTILFSMVQSCDVALDEDRRGGDIEPENYDHIEEHVRIDDEVDESELEEIEITTGSDFGNDFCSKCGKFRSEMVGAEAGNCALHTETKPFSVSDSDIEDLFERKKFTDSLNLEIDSVNLKADSLK